MWPELRTIPPCFVLYGETALALRLGHRQSLDLDFFTAETVNPHELLDTLAVLRGAKILQQVRETLTVTVDRNGPIKLSFFGGLRLGRIGQYENTADGVLNVASLLDLAGTKAAVITQRAEAKDYLDLLAITNSGISLREAMAAARALYGEQYNPILTLKALTYFGDGDLYKLSVDQKAKLAEMAVLQEPSLPSLPRVSDKIADPAI